MTDSDNWVEEQDRLAADQAQNVLDVLTRHGYTVVEDATDRAFTVEVREFRAPNGDVFVTACRGFVLPVEIAIVKIASGRGRGLTTLKKVWRTLRDPGCLLAEMVEGGSEELLSRYEITTPTAEPEPTPTKETPAPTTMAKTVGTYAVARATGQIHLGYIARQDRQAARTRRKEELETSRLLLEEAHTILALARIDTTQPLRVAARLRQVAVELDRLAHGAPRRLKRTLEARAKMAWALVSAWRHRWCRCNKPNHQEALKTSRGWRREFNPGIDSIAA